ncbi:MAG: VTT domain-containing protein [Anaerolineae bacterium]|nr:VTT domain-containing protein [Anaerolineae bacterium]
MTEELSLTELFLTGMITYGPPALGLALLLGALGIPLPSTLLLLAAGAFVRQGVLDGVTASGLGLLGAVLGDSASYAMGYFARGWVQRRFGQSATWQKAEATFKRRGGLAIYLTRFLLTPLAIPTNLIAGGSGYPYWRFLGYDVAGEFTWIVLYGGVGYAVGSQWELISQFISDFSGLLVGLVILGIGLYFLVRRFWINRRTLPQPVD